MPAEEPACWERWTDQSLQVRIGSLVQSAACANADQNLSLFGQSSKDS
jgi:hypothetical protein